MGEPVTPRRLPLPSMSSESNGDRPDRRAEAETHEESIDRAILESLGRFESIDRRLISVDGRLGHLEANVKTVVWELQQMRLAAAAPQRAPLPSFSSLDDFGEEIQTDHGGTRKTYSREDAEKVAAQVFVRMQAEAQQARDAAPVAFVRAKVIPAVALKVGTAFVVGPLFYALHLLLKYLHL